MMAGELDEAAQCLRRAIQLHPRERSATTHNTLANTLRLQGKLAEALEHYAISLSIEPDAADVRSNYLYVHNCLAEQNLSAIFQAHREFGARCDRPMPPAARVGGGTPGRLRVGYVSPDFRQHSVAHFIEPVLAAHDRERFEVFCYANNTVSDDTTRRLKALVPQWRLIHGRDDAEVAQLIRADGIDILVDLAGHTAKNRLPLFGLKPAPVQVTWLGYPNTTGMTTMDFRITDRFADPPGESDSLHTERLYRMPECFLCFLPPAPSPDVGPLPALHRGFVTFASFNNFAKITPQVIAAWARLLQRVPGSRLAMKNISMDAAHVREHLRTALARAGIEAARLELLSPSATPMEHLERYNAVDIGLDPFPYNGTTTTCDALWMGVPVVALEGRSHVGRVGVSLLNNAGLAQLVARDGDDYVEIAARLAGDLPRLASLRGALRERLRASPLMDAPRFTRHLEAAYADMWRAQRAEAA
jgi:predicted O-linked N-acetylglucosamine transferase (SPINDLY family)